MSDIRYINTELNGVVETLDEIERGDMTFKEFRLAIGRLLTEYRMSGHGNPWVSRRSTRAWRENS